MVEVNISASFWRNCSELRNSRIGKWMLRRGFAPWRKKKPPKFRLVPLGGGRFKLEALKD